LKTRLYLSCIVILAMGLCGSVLIYLTAEEAPVSAVSYVIVDGEAYPIAPQYSKSYLHELQRFGGKAAVLFDEFNRWFDALWHGKSLALTVGCISVFVALGIFLFANWLPSDRESNVESD
jgi:hypothetical protein